MSTTVMAYPEPRYILKYENGTKNQMMTVHLQKNAINNFTVHCEQQFAQEIDSVTYILELSNVLGVSTVFIRILKQGKYSTSFFQTLLYSFTHIEWVLNLFLNSYALLIFLFAAVAQGVRALAPQPEG